MRGRKLGAGKQRRAPHPDFPFYESLSLLVQRRFLTLKHQLWSEPHRSVCVYSLQSPWTSLACVLIRSLLVIPGGARWESSHVISPCSVSGSLPRFLSSSTCPLNFPQSPAQHQSCDEELGFLFSRWRAGAPAPIWDSHNWGALCHIIKWRLPRRRARMWPRVHSLSALILDVTGICSVASGKKSEILFLPTRRCLYLHAIKAWLLFFLTLGIIDMRFFYSSCTSLLLSLS